MKHRERGKNQPKINRYENMKNERFK